MLILKLEWQGGIYMTIKRMVTIMVALLMIIGMAVLASEECCTIAEEDTGISIVCEVTKPDDTAKPISATYVGENELFKNAKYIPETADEAIDVVELKVQQLKLTNTVEDEITENVAEVVEEVTDVVEEVDVIEETVPEETVKPLEEGTIIDPEIDESEIVLEEYVWEGTVINSYLGTVAGPNGKETYYNLNMSGVVKIMKSLGYDYTYSIREDGVKMYGPFIMVAADLSLRPRGSIIKTSLGWAMVCDTGEFINWNPTQLDIAVNW